MKKIEITRAGMGEKCPYPKFSKLLAKILTADNHELYEKLVKDMGETGTKFQSWWDRMGEKYQWESIEGGNWEINFETCEIYLVGGSV